MTQGQLDPIQLMRKIDELENKIDAMRTIEVGGVWQNWTPTVTAEGSMTISNLVVTTARYCLIGDAMALEVSIKFDTGGTASNQVNVSYPFTIISSSYRSFYSANNVDGFSPGWVYAPSGTAFGVRRAGGANWTIKAGLRIMANGIIKYK